MTHRGPGPGLPLRIEPHSRAQLEHGTAHDVPGSANFGAAVDVAAVAVPQLESARGMRVSSSAMKGRESRVMEASTFSRCTLALKPWRARIFGAAWVSYSPKWKRRAGAVKIGTESFSDLWFRPVRSAG